MNIKDILNLDKGMTVTSVSGHVKVAWERKEGTGEFGPYTTQGVVLQDDTDEIVCNIGNHPIINKGDSLIIKSKETKIGLAGITITEYKEKKQLKVTAAALVDINGTPQAEPKAVKPQEKPQEQPIKQVEPAVNWDIVNLHKERGMMVSIAKDLAVAKIIEPYDITKWADKFVDFIYKGYEIVIPF